MAIRKINNGVLELYDENDVIIMSIEERVSDNEILILISGNIKSEVAHEFEDEIMAVFSAKNMIRIDFSKVTYIASLALRVLLSLQQIIDEMPNSKMIICGLTSQIKQAFVDAGFYDILNIEE